MTVLLVVVRGWHGFAVEEAVDEVVEDSASFPLADRFAELVPEFRRVGSPDPGRSDGSTVVASAVAVAAAVGGHDPHLPVDCHLTQLGVTF